MTDSTYCFKTASGTEWFVNETRSVVTRTQADGTITTYGAGRMEFLEHPSGYVFRFFATRLYDHITTGTIVGKVELT